jgi:hypothetical protein
MSGGTGGAVGGGSAAAIFADGLGSAATLAGFAGDTRAGIAGALAGDATTGAFGVTGFAAGVWGGASVSFA